MTSKSHFAPLDRRKHKQAAAGIDVPDTCRYCGSEFLEHTNGTCPDVASILRRADIPALVSELSRRGYFRRGSGPKITCECGTCGTCKNREKVRAYRQRKKAAL